MSEENKGFAVSDRRHFHADGRVRETEQEPPRVKQEPASRVAADSPSPGAVDGPGPSGASIDFSQFLISIAAQAGLLLQSASEDAQDEAPDPEGVRQIISIFEMLQDKTEGRRTPEETRLLDQLLYELRMAYVTVRRKGGA
jgi:hypothetical protein